MNGPIIIKHIGILIKTLKMLNVINFYKFSEFSFLGCSRFLLKTEGPEVREAIACNLALVRPKSDVTVPSYGQQTNKT